MVHCVFRYNIVWPNLGSLSNKTYRRNDKTGPGKGPKIGGVLPQPFLLDQWIASHSEILLSNPAVSELNFLYKISYFPMINLEYAILSD